MKDECGARRLINKRGKISGMKILFIMYDNQSVRNHMPLGACYVAAYLKKNGYKEIFYYNQDVYHYPEEHLTQHLCENHFDIAAIGFAAGYYQYRKVKKICRAIDKAGNRPFVVLGGHGPTPEPGFFIKEMNADAVVMGEGEVPFLNLVKALERGATLQGVKGVAYKEGNKARVNNREEPVRDLDSIPFPYFEPLPMEYYLRHDFYGKSPVDRIVYVASSRGCNYRCNFCLRLEEGIRFRSAGNVVEEVKKYKKDYNANFIFFVDELFMFSKKRVFELTEAFIKAKLNIKYFCTGRVNIATPQILKMMKRSGCVYIDYGIEQFDNAALSAMDKKQTEDDILNAVRWTQASGIAVAFNIIFGNLGDTRRSLKKSLRLLKEYNDYGQLRTIRPVTPYPGSPLYYYALKKGLLKGPEDFYKKHKNLELLTVNFTDIPEKEFYSLLMAANKEIVSDYFRDMRNRAVGDFEKVYRGQNLSFRGVRH